MFKYFNHLGFDHPFYFQTDEELIIKRNFSEIISCFPQEKSLDLTAILEIFNKNYFLGDRTIVEGINRTPWMAKPNGSNSDWEYFSVPEHGIEDVPEKIIAEELFKRLCDEITEYIGERKNIGVLLSGGMDSRIVAGVLDHLIKKKTLLDLKVVALTWGNANSRDVRYAKIIADRLNWQWKHYTVSPQDLLNNIDEAAQHGCEFSPLHLHAIPQIRDDNELDLILAGSYGDSIGRAEYAGSKVVNLKYLGNNFRNVGSLFNPDVYKNLSTSWKSDIDKYHRLFPKCKPYQQYEQDYQLHYMRRLLNPCMGVISNKMPVYQVFTKPAVFGYMWSIKPERRNDNVYKNLLSLFVTKMEDIPWARTGLPYGKRTGTPDNFKKLHHSYKQYVSNDLYDNITKLILSDEIKDLGLFNMASLSILLKLIKKMPHQGHFYEEKLLWLASLARFITIFGVKNKEQIHFSKKNQFFGIIKTPLSFSYDVSSLFVKKKILRIIR